MPRGHCAVVRTVLLQNRYLRPFDRITREKEIADSGEAITAPVEQHEIARRRSRIVGIADQHRGTAIDDPRHEPPEIRLGIAVEIGADLALALEPQPVDELEPYILGQHVADAIEIARVEALDIRGEPRTLDGGCSAAFTAATVVPVIAAISSIE